MNRLARYAITLFAVTLLYGCDREAPEEQPKADAAPAPLTEEQRAQLEQTTSAAWHLAEPALARTEDNARQLQAAIEELLQAPSAETLAQAQDQWRETALSYQPLRLYPILADFRPGEFASLRHLNFAIAAHPIQPGYLDSVGEYAYSGLVHDISLPVTPETLRDQHGMTNDEDASLGIYAIQFMLFGAHESPRQASDYSAREQLTADDREQGFSDAAELPENRRRQILAAQAQVLLEDVRRLRQLWQPQAEESLYQPFMNLDPQQRQQLLLRSVLQQLDAALTLTAGTPAEPKEEAPEQETAETTEPETAGPETAAATATPSDPMVLPHMVARLEYASELLASLETAKELQQSVQEAARLLKQMQTQPDNAATAEQAFQALQNSRESLAGEMGAVE